MTRPKKTPSNKPVGNSTVAEMTQVVDTPRVEPVGSIATVAGPKPARKGNLELPSETGLGSMAYSDKVMSHYFAQPLVKKGEHGRDKWANTALVLVHRAQKAAQTYGKKDFNALYRLVLSAGIAFDKAFPQVQQPLAGNLVIQLFGSLGSETARRILEPVRPQIVDVTPQVEEPPVKGGDSQVQPSEEPLDETE